MRHGRKTVVAALLAAVLMVATAMSAAAADLKPQQTGQECGPNQTLWLHFVNNQLPKDTAAGRLTLKEKTLISGTVVFISTGPEEVLKNFTERVRPGGRWPFEVKKGIIGYRTLIAWFGGIMVVFGGMFLIGGLVLSGWSAVLVSAAVMAGGAALVYVGLRGTFGTD